jgi:hypothetical protein
MLYKGYFCDNSLTVTYSVLVVSCREFSCSLISLEQYTTLELSWCASPFSLAYAIQRGKD